MALKLKKSKTFPKRIDLIELAFGAGLSRSLAGDTIDALAQGIIEQTHQIEAFPGLQKSISNSVHSVMQKTAFSSQYRHQKKKKYPD